MKLIPRIGIDNLTFGMTQLEVIEILGKPDRVFEMEEDKNQLIMEWNKKLLRLTFYKDENEKLGYLRTLNPQLKYNGQEIINSNTETVKNEIFNELKDWEVDKYDFLTVHFNEKYWLSLNCEYGIVTDIEMGVPINDDDEYDWPEIEK